MKTLSLTAAWLLGALLVALILVAFSTGGSLALKKVFNPAFEQVRRDTFEQSKAYRDGAVQELYAMQFAYLQADPLHRGGLASVMRHKAAGLPAGTLPPDLVTFLKELP